MAIPATTDYFLVQNQFMPSTGQPEDVIVNTFIFKNTNLAGGMQTTSAQERAAKAVKQFFDGTAAWAGTDPAHQSPILGLLPNTITAWSMKVYDLGLPKGGRPPTTFDYTAGMPTRNPQTRFPQSVAVVLSLQTPIIGKRGKGRLYLGPVTSAWSLDNANGATVAPGVRARICAQAQQLAVGNGQDMEWSVWSTTRQKMARVVGGYVDNGFDTQRRRGVKANVRTIWGQITPTQQP